MSHRRNNFIRKIMIMAWKSLGSAPLSIFIEMSHFTLSIFPSIKFSIELKMEFRMEFRIIIPSRIISFSAFLEWLDVLFD